MDVYIAGEDTATQKVIEKIIKYCSTKCNQQINVLQRLPARGGQIKSQILAYNAISATTPVILLLDLDEGCPPLLIDKLMKGRSKEKNFIFNIAVDEVEAWLMADREGFAGYFELDITAVPTATKIKMGGRKYQTELNFPIKPSLYLTKFIMPACRNPKLRQQLLPKKGATKGPEYNTVITPFIIDMWNIDNARIHSDSLNRMIDRVTKLILSIL